MDKSKLTFALSVPPNLQSFMYIFLITADSDSTLLFVQRAVPLSVFTADAVFIPR